MQQCKTSLPSTVSTRSFHMRRAAHGQDEPRTAVEQQRGWNRQCCPVCRQAGVRKLVFTSANCLGPATWGIGPKKTTHPLRGRSTGSPSCAAEKLLRQFEDGLSGSSPAAPPSSNSRPARLLAILFEFIRENKTSGVVGSGGNHYQLSTPAIWGRPAFCLSATWLGHFHGGTTMYLVFVRL